MAVPTAVMTSSGEDSISRVFEPASKFGPVSPTDIDFVYEIPRCTEWINSNKFDMVALQLPCDLAMDTVRLIQSLQREVTAELVFLGDTSYGSCCVDEVQAQKLGVEAVIHFGPACLSPTTRLPVLFVFGRRPLQHEDCTAKFRELFPDPSAHIALMYDTIYAHTAESLHEDLCRTHPHLHLSELVYPDPPQPPSQGGPVGGCRGGREEASGCCGDGACHSPASSPDPLSSSTDTASDDTARSSFPCLSNRRVPSLPADLPLDKLAIFYVGGESRTLTNLMMVWNKCSFFTYDPVTGCGRKETMNVSKALMKRYYKIEQGKDAEVVGIVIGTLAVQGYRQMVDRMQRLIKHAGKRCYVFEVGQLTPAKLANYSAPEVFVVLTCPENVVLDSSDFVQPLLSPFELELACNSERQWTGDYVTDFRQLLPGAASFVDVEERENGEAQPDVSLITNKLRMFGNPTSSGLHEGGSALVERNNMAVAASGQQLASKSWRGLEPRFGETQVEKARQGRRGIAIAYENEPGTQ